MSAPQARRGDEIARWGDEIAVEVIDGVPYRMYVERPRRVEDLLAFAGRWGARPHIVQGDRVLTFDDMRKAVVAKAAELRDLGVTRGNRVFILGWNSPEWSTSRPEKAGNCSARWFCAPISWSRTLRQA